jgi:hypothetical protein
VPAGEGQIGRRRRRHHTRGREREGEQPSLSSAPPLVERVVYAWGGGGRLRVHRWGTLFKSTPSPTGLPTAEWGPPVKWGAPPQGISPRTRGALCIALLRWAVTRISLRADASRTFPGSDGGGRATETGLRFTGYIYGWHFCQPRPFMNPCHFRPRFRGRKYVSVISSIYVTVIYISVTCGASSSTKINK